MRKKNRILAVAGTLLWLGQSADAQQAGPIMIPNPVWDCYMPDGIPVPEDGSMIFEISIPLERSVDIGRTQFGDRSIAIGLEGSVEGPRLSGDVMEGALDFELTLANGTLEIEQILVLQAADGSYILARNAGTGTGPGPGHEDVRVVMDFEAPSESDHAWLNFGTYVARRELDTSDQTLILRVYDVTEVRVSGASAIEISRPTGVPTQSWDYRARAESESQGEVLITENVTLAPSQSVGPSKRGPRNIIPITGGSISGQISGKILMGGADYQNLSPPATIDARYLWETDDAEIIIVRNGGSFGSLVPTFEARVDGPYAYLNAGLYLSSNPGPGQGGVSLIFYESGD